MQVVMLFRVLGVILVMGALPTVFAASNPKGLNQDAIHSLYTDGEFEKAEAKMLAFQKGQNAYSRSDSLFIQKHLSVIYSANPDTREKGKYHMYQLLALDPNAKLVDMIISDEIDRIFTKVKEEFETRPAVSASPQAKSSAAPTVVSAAEPPLPANSVAAPASKSASKENTSSPKMAPKKSGNGWWLWPLAGAGLIAVGTTAYLVLAEPTEKTGADVIYPVDSKAKAP